MTPAEFAGNWKKKDGCAGGEELRLSLSAPPAGDENKNGPIVLSDRPASGKAIHVGAPVGREAHG